LILRPFWLPANLSSSQKLPMRRSYASCEMLVGLIRCKRLMADSWLPGVALSEPYSVELQRDAMSIAMGHIVSRTVDVMGTGWRDHQSNTQCLEDYRR
jgi:hypothetical protein